MDDSASVVNDRAGTAFGDSIRREFAKRKRVMSRIWYGGIPLALSCWAVAYYESGHGAAPSPDGSAIAGIAGACFMAIVATELIFCFAYFRCPACGTALYEQVGRGISPAFEVTTCPNCGVTLQ